MDTSLPILVVDDFQTARFAIVKRLRRLGYTDIDMAQDGTTAIKCLSKKRYGLVLSDWEMQPMGGEELLRVLRQESNVPVILITATASQEISRQAGANIFLPKPFNERDLEAAITRALLLR